MILPKSAEDGEYDAFINDKITRVKLSDVKGHFTVLVFYPLDFTFVCPTELRKLSDLKSLFEGLGAAVVFISGDSVYSHQAWARQPRAEGGLGGCAWPMIADVKHTLARQFGMFDEEAGITVRGTVILGSDLSVKYISAMINPIGRSSDEIVRFIQALRYYEEHGEICPIDIAGAGKVAVPQLSVPVEKEMQATE